MEKTLELIFTKSDGAKKTLSIADPREDVTLAEAQAAAARIIEAGVLTSGGLGLNEFVEARIKVVTVTVLAYRLWIPKKSSALSATSGSRWC